MKKTGYLVVAGGVLTMACGGVSGGDEPDPVSNEQLAGVGPIYPGVAGGERSIVYHGWNTPDTAYIAKHWRSMDSSGLDGTGYYVEFPIDQGEEPVHRGVYRTSVELFDGSIRWERCWFDRALLDLRETDFERLKRNHLQVWVTPANFDWHDDSAWQNVLHNTREPARFGAAAPHTAGMMFDAEQYASKLWYQAGRGSTEDFATVARKVRERGREWAHAVSSEWPDAELLMPWISDYAVTSLGGFDAPARATSETGLFLAFFEGMLQGLGDGVAIWEGNEHAYMQAAPTSFSRTSSRLRNNLLGVLSPDLRTEFFAHVRQSHGIYLDAYVNPEGTQYGLSKFGRTAADQLFRNTLSALSASDGLVWLWGEDGVIFEPLTGDMSHRIADPTAAWEDRIDGLEVAFDWARSPHANIERSLFEIAREYQNEQLLNAFPAASQGWSTEGWHVWKEANDTGTFSVELPTPMRDTQSLRVDGMRLGGCFIHNVPMTPLRTLLVTARARVEGDAIPVLIVRWRHPGGAFDMAGEDLRASFGPPDKDGIRVAYVVGSAPEQVHSAAVLLSVTGGEGAAVLFDEVRAFDFTDGPARLWNSR